MLSTETLSLMKQYLIGRSDFFTQVQKSLGNTESLFKYLNERRNHTVNKTTDLEKITQDFMGKMKSALEIGQDSEFTIETCFSLLEKRQKQKQITKQMTEIISAFEEGQDIIQACYGASKCNNLGDLELKRNQYEMLKLKGKMLDGALENEDYQSKFVKLKAEYESIKQKQGKKEYKRATEGLCCIARIKN